MSNLIKQFNEITLIKVFEVDVIDKRTNEQDVILFDITINETHLKASHVGLTTEEEQSNKIAFKSIELNNDFSLDENLQELHEECTTAIVHSDFYQLP